MIIVSQDKSVIVNFDNITLINKNDDEPKIFCEVNTRTTIMIGEYKTEERAKEVLEEFIIFYQKATMNGIAGDMKLTKTEFGVEFISNNVFYMPLE